jgi:hypothetical protein
MFSPAQPCKSRPWCDSCACPLLTVPASRSRFFTRVTFARAVADAFARFYTPIYFARYFTRAVFARFTTATFARFFTRGYFSRSFVPCTFPTIAWPVANQLHYLTTPPLPLHPHQPRSAATSHGPRFLGHRTLSPDILPEPRSILHVISAGHRLRDSSFGSLSRDSHVSTGLSVSVGFSQLHIFQGNR